MRSRTLFASSVAMGKGSESTEGGGEMRGEVGRDDCRFISLLAFLSLGAPEESRPVITEWCKESNELSCGLSSSDGCNDPDELTLPTRCRSDVGGGTLLWASIEVSMVRVRGRRLPLVCRKCCLGGLDSLLSYDSLKTSLKTMPCLRAGPPEGIERGEVCCRKASSGD